jgi:LmbE family N-acetylglucosaminyl deacetylase
VTHAGQTARKLAGPYPAPGQPGPAIFLSPHYDDAVLSCGGTIAGLALAGYPPLILTIFGGEAPEELVGPFAGWKHGRWGATTAEEILAIRRAEDLAAAAVLGCQTRWLGHLDAIYRGDRYTSDPELFGRLREIEAGLVGIIADEVCSVPEWRAGTTVYVPLGIGKHVDHQLTYAVGRRLAARHCGLRLRGLPLCDPCAGQHRPAAGGSGGRGRAAGARPDWRNAGAAA